MTEHVHQNHFNDDGEPVDPRVGAYAPRVGSTPAGPRNIQSLNNDINRNVRIVKEEDGSQRLVQDGVLRASTAGYGDVAGGPFSSMRNKTNSRPIVTSELELDSVVRVASNGLEMRLSSAVAAGFIVQRPDGSYAASGAASQSVKKTDEEVEKSHPDLDMDAFADSKDDETFTAVIDATNPGTQVSAVNEIASTGEIGPQLMARIANEMGTNPDGAQERLAPVFAAFQAQADNFVTERGLDPHIFYAWAKENKASELKAAMQDHGMKRTTRSYAGIVDSYVLSMDKHSPDSILGAEFGPGVTARTERGQILIRTPNGEMSWASAIRSGLIKLGK